MFGMPAVQTRTGEQIVPSHDEEIYEISIYAMNKRIRLHTISLHVVSVLVTYTNFR